MSDVLVVAAIDRLVKVTEKQNRILQELLEATKAANDTPLGVLEAMMAESAADAPMDEEVWTNDTGDIVKVYSESDDDELPESERWRLGE